MSKIIDLEKYDVVDVFAKKINENTLKAIKNFEKKFDLNEFMKKNENKENENVKITNVNVIIAKLEAEREELLQKILIYTFFVNYNIAKQLKTHRLKMLYTFIKDFVDNSFLIKKELYIYDKQNEDFKIYDKEMFAAKIESVSDTFNFYTTETKQKRNGDVETIKQYVINAKKFFNFLKINAENVKNINVSINPFNKETIFYIDKENKEAVLIKNKIILKEANKKILRAIGEKKKAEILEDYKKLWDDGEKLFDVLDFIIYGRFLSTRKELQLNINAPSSWGKGFFMGVLEDLGAGFTIKQNDFKGDRPSGLNVEKLQNSLCLLIDEFKKYNNYLFEINNYMQVEEKFGSRYKVAVYARLFFNAQKSESLVGYINEQITNRISLLEIKTNYLLINSSLYNKNKLIYKEVIKEFVYNYFKKKIDKITEKGEIEAERIADERVQQIIRKYKIKARTTSELIIDTIIEFLEDYKQYLLHKVNNENEIIFKKYTKKEVELFEKYIFYNENNQRFCILKFEDTIINTLQERLAERDFKKVEYSRGELREILEKFLQAEYKTTRISELKTVKKALVIKEQRIFRYKNNLNEDDTNVNDRQNKTDSIQQESLNKDFATDLLNANISYTANILNNTELKNDKNKMLLLTTLNNLLITQATLKTFTDIYKTNDINEIITRFIKDKAELLKQLNLYKNETYIQQKLQKTTTETIPF